MITLRRSHSRIYPAFCRKLVDGKDMRLSKIEYSARAEAAGILTFYMGKNTPDRKDYIMERLVVPVED